MYKPYRCSQGTIGEADQWREAINPVRLEGHGWKRYQLEPAAATARTMCCNLAMASLQADRGSQGEADLWREAVNPIRREGLR